MKLDDGVGDETKAITLRVFGTVAAEDMDEGEFDSCIVMIPPDCYRKGRLLLPKAGKALMEASSEAAKMIGEQLHHAVWTITNDRAMVKTLGSAHECPSCIAATDQALARLREYPDELVAVGHLWWVDKK